MLSKTFLQVSVELISYNTLSLNVWILTINIAPKLPVNKDKDYLKKKTYGKVPQYVQKIKKEIEDEY